MPKFGKRSKAVLAQANPKLVVIANTAIKVVDFSVLCSHRDQELQNYLFAAGLSKVEWPDGRHNTLPSEAIDVAPYPIDWNDRERFVYLAGIFMGIAAQLGIPLRWGGDWDGDGDLRDQTFMDLGHFELVQP